MLDRTISADDASASPIAGAHLYYRERLGQRPDDLPGVEWIGERTLSLPLSPKLQEGDVADVVAAVPSTLTRFSL